MKKLILKSAILKNDFGDVFDETRLKSAMAWFHLTTDITKASLNYGGDTACTHGMVCYPHGEGIAFAFLPHENINAEHTFDRMRNCFAKMTNDEVHLLNRDGLFARYAKLDWASKSRREQEHLFSFASANRAFDAGFYHVDKVTKRKRMAK